MVHVNRKRSVFPATPTEAQQIKLSCSDLQMLLVHYIQKGLLYQTPTDDFSFYLDRLVERLSEVLVKFYPLAGRLTTDPLDGGIYILCNDSGVDFIEATAENLTIADLTTEEVAPAVEELFALSGAVNLEGHHLPLLVIQVTRLKDGIAVCCTLNHVVADGTSVWNFFNSWSDLCGKNGNRTPLNPIYDRAVIEPPGSVVRLGLDPDGHVPSISLPPVRVKIFHFSAHMISRLKEQANHDSSFTISSFQALCAHVWRAVTRTRRPCPDDLTTFYVSVNCRPRLLPPLPSSYFGNAIQTIRATATCEELISLPISFSAGLLNGIIAGHMDGAIRERIDKWNKEPMVYRLDEFEKNSLLMGSSPRFQMYENDFGWGRPVAVRSGIANHFDGKISAYPGREGGGSVDLEVCLPPPVMSALESDPDFMCPSLLT